MSEEDKVKWNQRYQAGAYGTRIHPSRLLLNHIEHLKFSNALDVACGAGRNSLFLGEHGADVVGVDISVEAIQRAKKNASHLPNVKFLVADLDYSIPIETKFDLILVFRYVNLPLFDELCELLSPTGTMMVEQHLQWESELIEVVGPTNPRFRVTQLDLQQSLSELDPIYVFNGLQDDSATEKAAVSQYVGKVR